MDKWKERLKTPRFYLDVIIGILCIVLILCTIAAVLIFHEEYTYTFPVSSFQYNLEEDNYTDMLYKYYQNQGTKAADQANLQEYYHIALYFEAASYYKAYQEAGDTARMQLQQEKMNEHAENMGDFASVKERIDEKLGIKKAGDGNRTHVSSLEG